MNRVDGLKIIKIYDLLTQLQEKRGYSRLQITGRDEDKQKFEVYCSTVTDLNRKFMRSDNLEAVIANLHRLINDDSLYVPDITEINYKIMNVKEDLAELEQELLEAKAILADEKPTEPQS